MTITARLLAENNSVSRGTNRNILVREDSVYHNPVVCETSEIRGYQVFTSSKNRSQKSVLLHTREHD